MRKRKKEIYIPHPVFIVIWGEFYGLLGWLCSVLFDCRSTFVKKGIILMILIKYCKFFVFPFATVWCKCRRLISCFQNFCVISPYAEIGQSSYAWQKKASKLWGSLEKVTLSLHLFKMGKNVRKWIIACSKKGPKAYISDLANELMDVYEFNTRPFITLGLKQVNRLKLMNFSRSFGKDK